MGQVCTRDDEVDKVNDQPAANDQKHNENMFKAAAPVYSPPNRSPPTQAPAPTKAPEPTNIQPQTPDPVKAPIEEKIDAKHIEDLHLDATLLEPTNKMNAVNPTVQKRLDTIKNLNPTFHAELYRKYAAFPPGASIMREKGTSSTYQGQMFRGIPHGWGKLVGADGSVTQGFFDEGKPTGWVVHVLPNGLSYEGQMINFVAHGKGIQNLPDGRIIQCDTWINGQPDGKVVVKNTTGAVLYDGYMKNGKKNGQGISYDEKHKARFTGNFINDLLEGEGTRVSDNGEVYQGQFKAGIEDGLGTLTFIDGRKFNGPFTNGRPNGQGNLTTDTGKVLKQTYKDGKRV